MRRGGFTGVKHREVGRLVFGKDNSPIFRLDLSGILFYISGDFLDRDLIAVSENWKVILHQNVFWWIIPTLLIDPNRSKWDSYGQLIQRISEKSFLSSQGLLNYQVFWGAWKQRTSYWSFWEKKSEKKSRVWSLGWGDKNLYIVDPSKMDENGLINVVTEVLFHPFPGEFMGPKNTSQKVDPHRAPGSRHPRVDPNRAPAPRVTWRSSWGGGPVTWVRSSSKKGKFHEGKPPWKRVQQKWRLMIFHKGLPCLNWWETFFLNFFWMDGKFPTKIWTGSLTTSNKSIPGGAGNLWSREFLCKN